MTTANAALPILDTWKNYFIEDRNEGLGSSYERIMLNLKLSELYQRYHFRTALEAPSFGFTGLSGINSLWLTKQHGVEVRVADTDQERLALVESLWQEAGVTMIPHYVEHYRHLPLNDDAVDLSWNFASLWFVENLERFLTELTRVTRQLILISVPNQQGTGYRLRKYLAKGKFETLLNEAYIVPNTIIQHMQQQQWRLVEWDYIDIPPWPDIAMKKEEFLELLHLGWLLKWLSSEDASPEFHCIMEYYTGKKPEFEQEMRQRAWVERYAPRWFKYFWAHHKYFVFEPHSSPEQTDA